MDAIKSLLDIFLHLDAHLHAIIDAWGPWTYVLLFAIILCETGLVVTPFLPGDSLLFAAGAMAALYPDSLSILLLLGLLFVAAVLGDTLNYAIGRWVGPRAFRINAWFLKHEHLVQTQGFYERHGGKTIVLARFVPIIRTFAPFVAGVGRMHYPQFLYYNVVGGLAWVLACTLAGYFFGNVPIVKKNFELVVVGIVLMSVLPVAWEIWAARRRKLTAKP
ncbi:MAG: DedA family protein [Planctomycetia bacterium]|jgi:membrane-associated protein|nr:DedA family protein [Planctomycetia bacterium]